MTTVDITTNDARIQYTATAAQTAFVYDFPIFSQSDIAVIQNSTTLTLTTNYTVSGVGNESGGTVTLVTGATNGDIITIYRASTIERSSQYQVDGRFDAAPLERDLDKIITILQEQARDIGRAVTLSPASSISTVSLPTPTASNLIGWNAGATALSNYTLASFGDFDVVTSGLASNDMLKWNGTNWVNFTQVATTQIADNAVTAAKIAAGAVGISELDSTAAVDFISGVIESPIDQDYRLIVKSPWAGTITETTTISASGTCTATFKVNTTALGGTANSVSNSEQSQAHTSANTFVAGDDIVLTVSANSSCNRLSFTIKFTRTG